MQFTRPTKKANMPETSGGGAKITNKYSKEVVKDDQDLIAKIQLLEGTGSAGATWKIKVIGKDYHSIEVGYPCSFPCKPDPVDACQELAMNKNNARLNETFESTLEYLKSLKKV